MPEGITREAAWALLTEYNQEPFHLIHARTVEGVMRYFANALGYSEEADFWAIVGLLHDLDFERFPQEHCVKSQEIMAERGLDPRLIRATASHGWGLTVDIRPEHTMEKVLYAVDELTGLIGAVALMRPSKSVMDLELPRGDPAGRGAAGLGPGSADQRNHPGYADGGGTAAVKV